MKQFDNIDYVPVDEPDAGQDIVTLRLSGYFLQRWRKFIEICGGVESKVKILREALTVYFACASTDDQGNLVEVIIRRKGPDGSPLPDINLVKELRVPLLQKYIENRSKETS